MKCFMTHGTAATIDAMSVSRDMALNATMATISISTKTFEKGSIPELVDISVSRQQLERLKDLIEFTLSQLDKYSS